MSPSDIHKKKRRKNLVLLALIFAWCALIWAVTMVKLARAEELPPPMPEPTICTMDAMICPDGSSVSRTGPQCEFAPCPGAVSEDAPEDEAGGTEDDTEDGVSEGAAGYLPESLPKVVSSSRNDVSIDELFAEVEADELFEDESGGGLISDQGKFLDARKAHLQETVAAEDKMMQDGAEHQKFIESQPASWWENWQDKIDPEK